MHMLLHIIRETMRGKSLYRTFSNMLIGRRCRNIQGALIDLGGGECPSYERFWHLASATVTRTDIDPTKHPDVVVDLNKPLPFANGAFDHVFLFDVLYIIDNSMQLGREAKRILKPGGTFWVLVPFVFPEIREPHDYRRYTREGLEQFFAQSGFSHVEIESFGERFSVAAHILAPLLPRLLRIPVFVMAAVLDCAVPEKIRRQYPVPMGYFGWARK